MLENDFEVVINEGEDSHLEDSIQYLVIGNLYIPLLRKLLFHIVDVLFRRKYIDYQNGRFKLLFCLEKFVSRKMQALLGIGAIVLIIYQMNLKKVNGLAC